MLQFAVKAMAKDDIEAKLHARHTEDGGRPSGRQGSRYVLWIVEKETESAIDYRSGEIIISNT